VWFVCNGSKRKRLDRAVVVPGLARSLVPLIRSLMVEWFGAADAAGRPNNERSAPYFRYAPPIPPIIGIASVDRERDGRSGICPCVTPRSTVVLPGSRGGCGDVARGRTGFEVADGWLL
jgi:hypothetical protein